MWLLEANPQPSLSLFPSDEAEVMRSTVPLKVTNERQQSPDSDGMDASSDQQSASSDQQGASSDPQAAGAAEEESRATFESLPISDRWVLVYSAGALRQIRAMLREMKE